MRFFPVFLYCVFTILSVTSLVLLGYWIRGVVELERLSNNAIKIPTVNNPISKPDSTNNIKPPYDQTNYVEQNLELRTGEYYINDTVIIIPKGKENYALVATVSREQKIDKSVVQISRASFYDGFKWYRKSATTKVKDLNIYSDEITMDWNINVSSEISLRQFVNGSLLIGNNLIGFSSEDLSNEMPLRASPGYTKYFSTSDGLLSVDGVVFDANILYSRIYSSEPSEVLIYDDDFPFNTAWMLVWDESGNFYHADITEVRSYVENYASHQIGYSKNVNDSINKTYQVDVVRIDSEEGYDQYKYTFGGPIQSSILLTPNSQFDKYPEIDYTWIMGTAEAMITNSDGAVVKGKSIYEYIGNSED